MERYEANEWDSYVAAVQIESFGECCAEEVMVAEAGIWLRDFKAGKIALEDYHLRSFFITIALKLGC